MQRPVLCHPLLLVSLVVTLVSFPCVYVLWFKRGASVTVPESLTVDQVIRGEWSYDPGPLRFFPTSCSPENNLAFVNCVHCTPGHVDMVFRRYAYVNGLSVILPVGDRERLGWPKSLTVDDFRLSAEGFNLLSEPAVYDSAVMRGLMNNDTVFLTMIRHPLDVLASSLRSFDTLDTTNLTWKQNVSKPQTFGQNISALQMFLRNIDKHNGKLKACSSQKACLGPEGLSVFKNLMSHCLGMPLEGSQNASEYSEAVGKYISSLDSEFSLVMISEYIDESLVLLKRLMCWGFKDILHIDSNENKNGANASATPALTQDDRNLHRLWSPADYLLYGYFNRTFWKKVEAHGDDFQEDLAYYRYLQSQVGWFCRKVIVYGDSYIQFPETRVSPAFRVTSGDCALMEAPLLDMLKAWHHQRQQQREASATKDSFAGNFTSV